MRKKKKKSKDKLTWCDAGVCRHLFLGSCRCNFISTLILDIVCWEEINLNRAIQTWWFGTYLWPNKKYVILFKGINQSKENKSTGTFWRYIHRKLKTHKILQDSSHFDKKGKGIEQSQDFKHQLFWRHTYEISNTFCRHLETSQWTHLKHNKLVTK